MKQLIVLLVFIGLGQCMLGQTAPNFVITDTDGVTHNLYEDYLDQGKVVALKLFFVSCPLCKPFNEPFQDLYEEMGSGEDSVQFFLLTIRTWDNDNEVADYVAEYGLTFPAAGFEGGGYDATEPYTSGDFGTFFGTPSFYVIAPDRTVYSDFAGGSVEGTMNLVRDQITAVKGTGGEMVENTQVEINVTDYKGGSLPDYKILLRSSSNPDTSYEVPSSFVYPSEDYPALDSAEIVVEIDSFSRASISTIDLVVSQRHILDLIELDPLQVIAADVNGSGNVSGADLLAMRKFILLLKDEFDVGRSWEAIDSRCTDNIEFCRKGVILDPNLSQQTIDFTVIKYGDVK